MTWGVRVPLMDIIPVRLNPLRSSASVWFSYTLAEVLFPPVVVEDEDGNSEYHCPEVPWYTGQHGSSSSQHPGNEGGSGTAKVPSFLMASLADLAKDFPARAPTEAAVRARWGRLLIGRRLCCLMLKVPSQFSFNHFSGRSRLDRSLTISLSLAVDSTIAIASSCFRASPFSTK